MTTAQKIITVILVVVAASITTAVMMQAGASTLMQHIFVLCIAVAIDKVCRCPSSYYEASPARATSQVDDRDLFPEEDPTVIQALLSEPSPEQRSALQAYIDRRSRRERGEEAAMLERLRA